MEESGISIQDLKDIVKRRKKALIIPALVVFVIAAGVAFTLPRVYRSTGIILIEEQEIPKEYAISMVTSYAEQRIQTYTQRIMSSSRLTEIINRYNLYSDLRQKRNLEEIIEKMRKDIKLETVAPEVSDRRARSSTVAFTVSYEGENPEAVQQVANTLASLYLQENLKVRGEKTAGASKFMEDEMKEVQASLARQDAKIAEYKQKHINALPELSQMNLQELERLERNIEQYDIQLRFLKERESSLGTQLAGTPRYLLGPEKERQENESREKDRSEKDKDRLKELELRLVYFKTLYTERHPDVIKLKQEIADLEKKIQTADEEAAAKPEPPPKPDRPAYRTENPVYITISSQLSGTKAEIDSVKRQIATAERRRQEYIIRIERSPRVEEGYRGLISERNNLQAKYDDLMKKYMETRVASGMEKEQMGERFTLIDPPRLPVKPVKPNVPAILLIGAVLGIGGGIGLASLKEFSDHSVRSVEALARATGYTVLASIPEILTGKDIARMEKKRRAVAYSVLGGLIICVAVFHFFIMDLDVLWAKLARRLPL